MINRRKQIKYFTKGLLSVFRFIKPLRPGINHSSKAKVILDYFAKVEEYVNIAVEKTNN